MRRIVVAGDMPFLPEEIVRDILIRLPVKTLIRSRCVCKHWENLISDMPFLPEEIVRDILIRLPMKPHKVDIAPVNGSPNTFQIVGSSNGLLCVSVHRYPECYPFLLLWNPATRVCF
ncbi:hypothetical protein K1719_040384 [Acacia pycnantha]|nr:hypothetical protein K1719_040384 [Acacia pycnantha]